MQPDTTAGPQITQFPPPTRKMLMISTDVDKGDDANSMTEKSEVCIDLEANPVVAEPGHTDPSADKDKVLWDGPNDTDNPIHWPTWKKFLNGGLISFLTLLTPLASSFFAPSVPEVMQEFNTDNDLLSTFVVSIYVLGFAFGPLLMAPLSEIYGRVLVYHACNVGFVIFVVACAMAPSLEALIAFRFMSGLFGSCPLANAIGSIADMVLQEKCASAIVSLARLLFSVCIHAKRHHFLGRSIDRTSCGTYNRANRWRFPSCRERLALGLLGPSDRCWSSHHRDAASHARDIRTSNSRAESETLEARDREQEIAFDHGQRPVSRRPSQTGSFKTC